MNGGKIRVFCVEDHEELMGCYRLALDSEPDMELVGSLATTEGLAEAIEAARPSVLVLDRFIRGCEPLEALGTLHARFPTLAILVASAWDDCHMVDALLRCGASGFVLKGNLAELTEAIRKAAAGERVSGGEGQRLKGKDSRAQS